MPSPTPTTLQADAMPIKELAERTGTHYTTVWELARRNELPVPVFRVGRRYFVSRKAYDELMSAQHEPHVRTA